MRASELFQGPFGRLFRALPPADYGADDTASQKNLTHLALLMTAPMDPPSDGPDPEESGIPAAFTYFGQFIDHDLTFDPASSLQRQNDPDALVDYRTPRFDLDNIYGRGPDDQPYLYADATTFLLGDPMTGGAGGAFDLPRSQNTNPQRAIIGDPRNDENVIRVDGSPVETGFRPYKFRRVRLARAHRLCLGQLATRENHKKPNQTGATGSDSMQDAAQQLVNNWGEVIRASILLAQFLDIWLLISPRQSSTPAEIC